MSYKTELTKIYKKIDTISKKGKDGVFDYYIYIDQLIDSSQYSKLEDVMNIYYDINIGEYLSINDFKKDSYPKIREKTTSSFQKQLKALCEYRSVYQIGFHFYDSINNHYLGDIKEIEEPQNWIAYKDPKLTEIQDQIRIIDLEVTSGLQQSIIDSIPPFVDDRTLTIDFNIEDLVRYEENIYECTVPYTYNVSTPITPTYSNYWMQIYSPTYSLTIIDSDEIKLIDKYNQAIDIVKSFIYSDPSSSNCVQSNYMDD
jgi:hypothetical protein